MIINERHEAAMAIAIINKVSKLVYDGIRLNSIDAVEYVLSDYPDIEETTESIINYIEGDKDKKLFDQLTYLVESSQFKKFYKTIQDEELQKNLSELMDCLDKLHEYASQCTKEYYKDYPDLVPFFANEEIKDLLDRAVSAGFLDEKYQPKKTTKRYHLKLIAYAIANIKELKTRNKWCHFEKLWKTGCNRISAIRVPMTKARDVYRVTKLYPEVDFYSFLNTKECEKTFKTSLNKQQATYLCDLLKTNGFLDAKVSTESFLAIMKLLRLPPSPINWTGSLDSLIYFTREMYMELNPSFAHLTANWFTNNNANVNYGTIKTKSSLLNRFPERYDFIPLIDKLILQSKQFEE